MMGGFDLGMNVWGIVMMILFLSGIGGILVLFFWLLRSVVNSRRDKGSTPKAILDQRYAKGDITKEDYETSKKDLSI